MKTKLNVFFFLLIGVMLLSTTACKKHDRKGMLSFYTDSPIPSRDEITVTIDGESHKITDYYGVDLEKCQSLHNANFELETGKYPKVFYYLATTPSGLRWEGEIEVDPCKDCTPILLQRPVAPPPAYGDVAFWTRDPYFGTIYVQMNQMETTTDYAFNDAPPCTDDRAALFQVPANAEYYVTAFAAGDSSTFGFTAYIEEACNRWEFVWDGSGKNEGNKFPNAVKTSTGRIIPLERIPYAKRIPVEMLKSKKKGERRKEK